MKKTALSILVISVVSGAIGFFSTSMGIRENDLPSAQSWSSIPFPIDYSESSNRFLTELIASGAFPLTELQSNRIVMPDLDPDSSPRPTVPKVIAIGILDGVYTAQIISSDGELRTVRQDDQIVDDWSVKTIDMHKLVMTNSTDDITIEY